MLTLVTTNKTSAVKIQRTMSAPLERVWKAWTDPNLIVKWFGCEECVGCDVSQDFTVGGAFQVLMHLDNGATMRVHGVFKEIVPMERLCYTWNSDAPEFPADDTLVTVEFRAVGDKTELSINHTNFALEKSAQGHSIGWAYGVNKFADLVEAN